MPSRPDVPCRNSGLMTTLCRISSRFFLPQLAASSIHERECPTVLAEHKLWAPTNVCPSAAELPLASLPILPAVCSTCSRRSMARCGTTSRRTLGINTGLLSVSRRGDERARHARSIRRCFPNTTPSECGKGRQDDKPPRLSSARSYAPLQPPDHHLQTNQFVSGHASRCSKFRAARFRRRSAPQGIVEAEDLRMAQTETPS
jgi:hypothetical protein